MKTEPVIIEDILIGARHRPLSDDAVDRLVESISRVGLLTPITVHDEGERLWLVAGHHRLAAMKKLGWDMADVFVIYGEDIEIELREIAENLHREDLSKLERDNHLARWIELTDVKEVSTQVVSKPKGGRPEGGVRAAWRELGVNREDARRAVKVASLSDEAKKAAVDHGLDDNRSALLAAAKENDPKAQVAKIVERAAKKSKGNAKQALPVVDDIVGKDAPLIWRPITQEAETFLEEHRQVHVIGRQPRWVTLATLKEAVLAGKAAGWFVADYNVVTGEFLSTYCASCAP